MHRRPLVVALLISIAFLLFFSHLYITWEISQNTFTEFPGPRISGLFPASNVNQSENFNLYGSSIELTAFANITYNASIPANSNTTVVPILSIEILRVSYNNIAVPIERVTYRGTNMLNSTTVNIGPGNYVLNSSFQIHVYGNNKSAIRETCVNVASSLKGMAFVNANFNSYPYIIAIPTYVFLSLSIAFFGLLLFYFRNDYDIRNDGP
ncbi:MAG: hypothetical protein M1533_00540 [Candidatus Thermoplasmatota archaeon]|jgi:hypothetical protein|nr:hypothetical protein [Candidatus Thermoplasmatota archaeon]MCL5794264.1 hypothetical protein [Candidatus Thermoplasmatota archaeon]